MVATNSYGSADVTQDNQLLGAVNQQGRNRKVIRDLRFAGRSRNDVKNRHTILMRRGSSSASANFAKRHTLELVNDEEEDQNERSNIGDNNHNDEEDDDDNDDNEGDDNNNTDDDDENNILRTGTDFASGRVDQGSMDLDQYLTPFPSFEFSAETAPLTQSGHTFSLPYSISDPMHLDSTPTEHHYPLEPPSNGLDIMARSDLEPDSSNIPWSFSSVLAHTASLPADSILSQPPIQPQPLVTPTYKRVTLVLEDYERGLMDQLLQIVSTSQGKSQIEILP